MGDLEGTQSDQERRSSIIMWIVICVVGIVLLGPLGGSVRCNMEDSSLVLKISCYTQFQL